LNRDVARHVYVVHCVNNVPFGCYLLDSLDKTDIEVERNWVAESETRYQAYKDGRIEGVPLEQIRTKFES